MAHAMKRSNGHTRHITANTLKKDYQNIKDAFKIAQDDLKHAAYSKSIDLQDDVADYMVQKPFKTIGVAMLTGFVLGYLLRK